MNTLSEAVMKEFVEVMGELQNDNRVKSAVLSSGKADCFIAGADIRCVFNIEINCFVHISNGSISYTASEYAICNLYHLVRAIWCSVGARSAQVWLVWLCFAKSCIKQGFQRHIELENGKRIFHKNHGI